MSLLVLSPCMFLYLGVEGRFAEAFRHVRNTLGLVASTVNDIPLETHRGFTTHIFDGTQGRDIQ